MDDIQYVADFDLMCPSPSAVSSSSGVAPLPTWSTGNNCTQRGELIRDAVKEWADIERKAQLEGKQYKGFKKTFERYQTKGAYISACLSLYDEHGDKS
jgi:hypothetical protein